MLRHAPSGQTPTPIGRRGCMSPWIGETGFSACARHSWRATAGSRIPTRMATLFGMESSMPPIHVRATIWCRPQDVWFIAAQQRLLPVLCVQTNRVVSFSRPAAPSSTGVNTYGGAVTATNEAMLTDWPASVIGVAGRGRPSADLPSDSSIAYWTVLIPALTEVILRPSDLMTDDLGRNAVVAGAELTALGWRITVKQATT